MRKLLLVLLVVSPAAAQEIAWQQLTNYPASCPANEFVITVGDTLTCQGVSGSAVDHGTLSGLTPDDDHTQYALLAGRAGGQTLIGGTGSADLLTLKATTYATGAGYLELDGSKLTFDSTHASGSRHLYIDAINGIVYLGDSSGTVAPRFEVDGNNLHLKAEAAAGVKRYLSTNQSAQEVVVNDEGLDIDFRAEGNIDTDLLHVNAGTDTVQIGKLNVNGAFTLPTADGTNNQVMTTDGSGTLGWESIGDVTGGVTTLSWGDGGSGFSMCGSACDTTWAQVTTVETLHQGSWAPFPSTSSHRFCIEMWKSLSTGCSSGNWEARLQDVTTPGTLVTVSGNATAAGTITCGTFTWTTSSDVRVEMQVRCAAGSGTNLVGHAASWTTKF